MDVTGITSKSHGSMLLELIAKCQEIIQLRMSVAYFQYTTSLTVCGNSE